MISRADAIHSLALFAYRTLGPGEELDAFLRWLAEMEKWDPDSDQPPPKLPSERLQREVLRNG